MRRSERTTGPEPAHLTSFDALQELLDEDLWAYVPEPEDVVVEINPAALDELPEAWTVEAVGEDVDVREAT